MATDLQGAISELSATASISGAVMREAREEIERLRLVNGELLAALKKLVAPATINEHHWAMQVAFDAIRKAESQPRLRDEGSSREDGFFEPLER